jgi:hypothetical protein
MGQRPGGKQNAPISSGKDSYGSIKNNANLLLKEEINKRESAQTLNPQQIPGKDIIGKVFTNNIREKSFNNYDSSLVSNQLADNPFYINATKKI